MRVESVGVLVLPLLLARALILPLSRAVVFQPSNLGNILPDMTVINRTMGHSSWMLSLGLEPDGAVDSGRLPAVSGSLSTDEEDEDDRDIGDAGGVPLVSLEEVQ